MLRQERGTEQGREGAEVGKNTKVQVQVVYPVHPKHRQGSEVQCCGRSLA